jgi:hypothetical protein
MEAVGFLSWCVRLCVWFHDLPFHSFCYFICSHGVFLQYLGTSKSVQHKDMIVKGPSQNLVFFIHCCRSQANNSHLQSQNGGTEWHLRNPCQGGHFKFVHVFDSVVTLSLSSVFFLYVCFFFLALLMDSNWCKNLSLIWLCFFSPWPYWKPI